MVKHGHVYQYGRDNAINEFMAWSSLTHSISSSKTTMGRRRLADVSASNSVTGQLGVYIRLGTEYIPMAWHRSVTQSTQQSQLEQNRSLQSLRITCLRMRAGEEGHAMTICIISKHIRGGKERRDNCVRYDRIASITMKGVDTVCIDSVHAHQSNS